MEVSGIMNDVNRRNISGNNNTATYNDSPEQKRRSLCFQPDPWWETTGGLVFSNLTVPFWLPNEANQAPKFQRGLTGSLATFSCPDREGNSHDIPLNIYSHRLLLYIFSLYFTGKRKVANVC